MTWRQKCAPIIAEVIAANPTLSGDALRRAVSDAYPFGHRSNFVCDAWLAAVADALGPSEKKLRAISEREAKRAATTGQGALL